MPHVALLVACLAVAPAAAPDVVELLDGSRLVGEIRNRGEAIELTGALGILHFGAAEIARLERRNDLLPGYRYLRSAAGGKGHALLSAATWALDHGLYPEAFDCADDAREAVAPADALAELERRLACEALLEGCAPLAPPADDATRGALLARVAGRSASRAAVAAGLLRAIDEQTRIDWLLDRLARGTPAQRRGAVALLAEATPLRALGKLVRASLLDADGDVRDAARDAALGAGHPDLVVAYLKALDVDSSTLRQRAYPALAELRDPRAVDGLLAMFDPRPANGGSSSPPRAHVSFVEQRAYVQDFDTEIAQGAVIAKPVIGVLQSGVVLDVAVAGVFVIPAAERRAVLRTLAKLTGEDFGSDVAAWRSWWSGARPQWAAEALARG